MDAARGLPRFGPHGILLVRFLWRKKRFDYPLNIVETTSWTVFTPMSFMDSISERFC